MNLNFRKILIFIATAFVILAAILYSLSKVKKTRQQPAGVQNGSLQSIPSLPESQTAVSPDLNSVKKNTQDELAVVQSTGNPISEKDYKDLSERIISLSDFAKANGVTIQESVLQNSSQTVYKTFFCAREKSEPPAIGLMLQLRQDADPNKYRDLYPKMKSDMKDWEKTIFGDLAGLYFPQEFFKTTPEFKEAKYITSNQVNTIPIRFANLISVSGRRYSVDWGFLNDQVYISNSKDCLRLELDKNADAYEP